jgi:peptide/nickel transport system substrate-binding protein
MTKEGRLLDRREALALSAAAAAFGFVGPREARSQEARRGGSLAIGFSVEPAGLDPAFGDAPSVDRSIYNMFYDNLFYLGTDGSLQPALATGWEVASDGLSLTCRLRHGVRFHDGAPFDAASVKASIERVVDPALNAPYARSLTDLAGVDVVDPATVRIRLKQPSGAIMTALATEPGMIVRVVQGQDIRRNPNGTGPFRFRDWVGGNALTAVRNDHYWAMGDDGRPLPYLDQVTFRFIRNTTVKITEARAGSIQIADSIQSRDFEAVGADPNLTLPQSSQGIHQWMSFNVSKPPFNNPDLRRAALAAINRDALSRVVTGRHGRVTPTLITPEDWVFEADLPSPRHDLAAARQHLQRSGFTGEVTIAAIQRDPDTQIAQLLQAQFQQAGLRSRVEVLERQAWLDRVLKKNHEIGLLQIHQPRPDPDATFAPSFGKDAAFNWSGVEDPELFELVERARKTADRAQRRALYVQIQRRILESNAYGFLFTRPIADIVRKGVSGLKSEVHGPWRLGEVRLTAV